MAKYFTQQGEVVIGGLASDDTPRRAKLDDWTHVLVVEEYLNYEINRGHVYRGGFNYTLANGNVATFGFVTPNTTTWAHMEWELDATADGTFTLLEACTALTGGAAVTPINQNRNSTTASVMVCTKGMTGSDLIEPTGGTAILNAVLGTGKGSTVSNATGAKFIFKQNTKYLFRYTNGTSANIIRLRCLWRENANLS